MHQLKHPATLISMVALFAALSGGAIAGTLISGSQIKNHSIPAKKLTASAIRSLHGQRGPAGPAGAAGPAGPAGLIDLTKLTRVDSGQATVAAGASSSVTASCASGAKAVGGGFIIVHGNDDLVDAYGSAPATDLSGWTTAIVNGSAANAAVEAYAICVSS